MPVPTNARGHIRWPQPGALAGSLAGTELADLMAEEHRLTDDMAQVQQLQRHQQNVERTAAEQADREAYAVAIRTGAIPRPRGRHQVAGGGGGSGSPARRAAAGPAHHHQEARRAKLAKRHDDYAEDAARREADAHAALVLLVAELGEAVRDFIDARTLVDRERRRPSPRRWCRVWSRVVAREYTATDLLERLTAAVQQWKR